MAAGVRCSYCCKARDSSRSSDVESDRSVNAESKVDVDELVDAMLDVLVIGIDTRERGTSSGIREAGSCPESICSGPRDASGLKSGLTKLSI